MLEPFREIRGIFRRMARAPVFTLTLVVTLALGIGATTAVFTVVDGVLLKPISFAEPERLVGLWHTWPGQGLEAANISPALYFTYREENRVFEDVGMWDNDSATVTGIDQPERVAVIRVTDGTLPLLGTRPQIGRWFTREDDSPGSALTVVLSHDYWQQRFGGDPGVLGSHLMVSGLPRMVIGVARPDLHFLRVDPSLYLPFRFDRSRVYVGNFSFQGVARLRPGATLEAANADVARMIPLATETFRGIDYETLEQSGFGPLVRPLSVDVVGDVGDVLWVLLGTVGLVLLIACANVANLLLVRVEGRQTEVALRSALGASGWRRTMEAACEALTLASLGGLAGLALARLGVGLLLQLRPQGLPRLDEIGVDGRVAAFAATVSILAAGLAVIIPLTRGPRGSLAASLAAEGRAASAGRERHRARNALVVCQMALALVLLVASGLMIRSVRALSQVDPGFRIPEQVQTLRLSIPDSEVAEAEGVVRHHREILRGIESLAGVDSAALTSSVTMDGWDSNDSTEVEGFPLADNQMAPSRRYKWISPGYFATMGNPLLAGRDFTWDDVDGRLEVAIVTANLAAEYWGSPAQAMGRRLRESERSPWREIVGVVGDIRDDGVSRPARTTVFWPMRMGQFWGEEDLVRRSMVYVLRTERAGTLSLLDEIRQAVWSVNPSLPLANVWTMEEILDRSMARVSFTLVMLLIAALSALLLGAVGIYGVASYIVSLRVREIGVRIALGAQRNDVSRLVLRQALSQAAAGVVLGVLAAVGLTRLMASLLYGVSPLDSVTYAVGALVVAGLALLASYRPARRAALVDPIEALRSE